MNSIVGHKSQIEQLKKALASGKLPNAYLFSGPRGVGKRMVADSLAMAIACPSSEKSGWQACKTCASCNKVGSKNHPDQFVIEPDGESIKIDQIRELQGNLQFHPLESFAKLAMIDEADRMTDSAANSLLKLLEEPPQSTHLILISSLPHRLLPTIRSRCRAIAFAPLADDEIAKFLISKRNVREKEALRVARFAGGSLGTAIAIDIGFVDEVLEKLLALTRKASSADIIETSHAWAHESPEKILLILDILAGWYRDIFRYQATGGLESLIHTETINFSKAIPFHRTEQNLTEITRARATLYGNANKQLMFEQLLFTLTD